MTEPRRPPLVFYWFLRAFPRPFRDVYTRDMAADFARRLDNAHAIGARRVAALWLKTGADVVVAGLKERRHSSFVSTRTSTPVLKKRGRPMAGWTQDLRYAFRRLRREPSYALFAAITLALGIGANVAVFSVVDSVLFSALPYYQSDRLVSVYGRFLPESGFDFPEFPLSVPEFADYQRENRTMSGAGAWQGTTATFGGPGEETDRIDGAAVTPSLFDVLRVAPARGRPFNNTDRAGANGGVIILNHGLWQRRFGGREEVVGENVFVNGTTRLVIGVMPRDFAFPTDAQYWVPLVIDPANPGNRQGHGTNAIARLADGVSLQTAEQEMNVLMSGWKARFPTIHTGHFLFLTPLLDDTVGTVRPILSIVAAATAFLLLIVCANIASLALARAERHARELAIRSALGSGRWRLVRLSAVESGVLAVAGGVGGGLLATGAVSWLRQLEGIGLPRMSEITVDWRVWVFAAAGAAIAACLLGILPALRSTAARLAPALRLDTRTSTGAGRTWLRRSLVTLEVALAVVLVTGALLMVRSFARMISVDTGFQTGHVLLGTVSLPVPAYSDDAKVGTFFTSARERLAALPGVTRATFATNVPVVSGIGVWDFVLEGRPTPGPGQPAWNAAPTFAADGYFEALDVKLVKGRFFTSEDRAGTELVAVISEAFARKFFAGEEPIGRRLRVCCNPDRPYARIVGIAGDIRDQSLRQEPRPLYFLVQAQTPALLGGNMRQVTFVLRSDGDAAALSGPLRSVIKELEPTLAVSPIRTYDSAMARTVAQPRFATLLLAVFAAFGLALGLLGVYGVLAYTIAERTQEFGIRRALGAPPSRLVRLVLMQGLAPVLVGIVIGTGAAIAASDLISSELFGISPTDTVTYAIVAGGVLVAAILACLLPARRALRVSPLTALRGA